MLCDKQTLVSSTAVVQGGMSLGEVIFVFIRYILRPFFIYWQKQPNPLYVCLYLYMFLYILLTF
jgi:hypothetical protein